MPLDVYAPCPCGSGKKVKFCCAADIVKELGEVIEMIEADQRIAAVDRISHLLDKKPNNPALLAVKATTQLELGEGEAAKQTASAFLKTAPDNPVALALAALTEIDPRDLKPAIIKLQRAIEQVAGSEFPFTVYEAVRALARILLATGHYISGRAHLVSQVALEGGQSRESIMAMMQVNSSPQVPLLLKDERELQAPPAESSLAAAEVAQWNGALESARRMGWLSALKQFEQLAAKHPAVASLWRNIAQLRAYLADSDGSADAYRKLAVLPDLPEHEAIEATALAERLEARREGNTWDDVVVTFAVPDASALREFLLSHKQVRSIPVDPREYQEENEAPPLAVFELLDRELPRTAEGLTYENAPRALGEILLYGKETDRDARLEFLVIRSPEFDRRIAALKSVCGNLLGAELKQEKEGEALRVLDLMTPRTRLPGDVSRAQLDEIVQAQWRHIFLTAWPDLRQGTFGGKTLREVAADPNRRVEALAHILIREQIAEAERIEFDFDEVRRSLGLPVPEPIDPTGVRLESVSLSRLRRVDATKLTSEQLEKELSRAVSYNAVVAARNFAKEMLTRGPTDAKFGKLELCGLLARLAANSEEALKYVLEGQAAATAAGKSPAELLLQELPIRIERGETEELKRIVQTIETKHMREPGIAQAYVQMLVQYGLITPEQLAQMGMLGPAMGGPPRRGPGAMPAPAAAAPAAGGVWSPEAAAPAPAGKSKLWLPGMD
jgi:hypothetical protein